MKDFSSLFHDETNFSNCGITTTWPGANLELKDVIINCNLVTCALKIVPIAAVPDCVMGICWYHEKIKNIDEKEEIKVRVWWCTVLNATMIIEAIAWRSSLELTAIYVPGWHPLV